MDDGTTTNMRLGERLRHLRQKANLSLRELSARTGLSAPFLIDLEKGQRSTTRYRELAAALDCTPAELMAADRRLNRAMRAWIDKHPDVLDLLSELRNSVPPKEVGNVVRDLRERLREHLGLASVKTAPASVNVPTEPPSRPAAEAAQSHDPILEDRTLAVMRANLNKMRQNKSALLTRSA